MSNNINNIKSVKEILAVINATYAVAKRKPEKIRLAGYITNQFNDQLPVGLLAQLVRALHRYRRGQGQNLRLTYLGLFTPCGA